MAWPNLYRPCYKALRRAGSPVIESFLSQEKITSFGKKFCFQTTHSGASLSLLIFCDLSLCSGKLRSNYGLFEDYTSRFDDLPEL